MGCLVTQKKKDQMVCFGWRPCAIPFPQPQVPFLKFLSLKKISNTELKFDYYIK